MFVASITSEWLHTVGTKEVSMKQLISSASSRSTKLHLQSVPKFYIFRIQDMCLPSVKPSQQMSLTSSSVFLIMSMVTSLRSQTGSKPLLSQSTVDCHKYVDVKINHKNGTLPLCAKHATNKTQNRTSAVEKTLPLNRKEKRYRKATSA